MLDALLVAAVIAKNVYCDVKKAQAPKQTLAEEFPFPERRKGGLVAGLMKQETQQVKKAEEADYIML